MSSLLILVILVISIAIALAYAVSGTVSILRTTQLTRSQKYAQTFFVWVLPVLGPLLVMHLLADRDAKAIPAG